MPRTPLVSDQLPTPVAPYSAAVLGTPQLYVSGQVALDAATGALVGVTVEEQCEKALDNVRLVLEAAGKTEADVLRVQLYLADMKDFAAVNAVYQRFFSSPYPARTAIGVASLPLGALIEIDVLVG